VYWARKCVSYFAPAVIVSTKLEVDMTIRYLVVAFLRLIRYVTLWPWPFNLSHTRWLASWSTLHQVWRSYAYQFLSYDVFRVCIHCACAVPCDLCVCRKYFPYIWNPWPRFVYSLYDLRGCSIFETSYLPKYRSTIHCSSPALCACAKSRDLWIWQKQLRISNPRPQFAYSLCNFCGGYIMIKCRLQGIFYH